MQGVNLQVALAHPRSNQRKQFKYDKVFGPSSTQEEVYEDTKALIRSVLDGAYSHWPPLWYGVLRCAELNSC